MSLKPIWDKLDSRQLLWIVGLSMVYLVIIGWLMPVYATSKIKDLANQDQNLTVINLEADQIFQLSKSSIYQETAVLLYAFSRNEPMGKPWGLQEIRYNNGETITVNHSDRYTLEFISDVNMKIRADCNRVRGSYRVNGSELTIQIGPMTRVACSADSIADGYLRDLGRAAHYFIQDSKLYVDLKDNVGTMIFAPI